MDNSAAMLILAALRVPDRNTRWMDEAACRNAPPDLFYPEDYEIDLDRDSYRHPGPTMRQKFIQVAKTYCASCPVTRECLADANLLEHNRNETHGIRAGLTRKERYEMRKDKAA